MIIFKFFEMKKRIFFLVSQVLPFRHKRQTNKNVADTSFNFVKISIWQFPNNSRKNQFLWNWTKLKKIHQKLISTKINSLKVERAVRKLYKSLLKYLIVINFLNNFTLIGHKIFATVIILEKASASNWYYVPLCNNRHTL